jgi:hypothetical protein
MHAVKKARACKTGTPSNLVKVCWSAVRTVHVLAYKITIYRVVKSKYHAVNGDEKTLPPGPEGLH